MILGDDFGLYQGKWDRKAFSIGKKGFDLD